MSNFSGPPLIAALIVLGAVVVLGGITLAFSGNVMF